ncbi:MAG: ATP-binding cassette domain-containing protein [Actinobacteria bacterium]|nr:ATP-binding cassette domain-containing protein [Actinomycetota bacterium]
MAEQNETPRDASLDDAIIAMVAAGTPFGRIASAHRFPSPLLDAYSVALTSMNEVVRAPDPRVERQLSPLDAISAASGVLTAPAPTQERWWDSLPGPAVTDAGDSAEAILPYGSGAEAISGGTRVRSRFRGAKANADTVIITGSLPSNASWLALIKWSLRGRGKQIGVLLLLSLVGGSLALILPLATSALFAVAVPMGDANLAAGIMVTLALAGVGGALLLVARNFLIIRLRNSSDTRLAPGVMAHLLRQPMTFFRRMSPGEILDRTLSVDMARVHVNDGTIGTVINTSFALVNLLFLFAIDAVLGLVIALAIGITMILMSLIQRRIKRLTTVMMAERSDLNSNTMSLIEAIVPIRVGGAESRALARWTQTAAPALSTVSELEAESSARFTILAAAPLVMNTVLVLAVASQRGAFTAAAFMGAFVAVAQLTIAMTQLTQSLYLISELKPALERMVPITSSVVERPGPARAPGALDGRIQITNVVFGYDLERPPLLDGLTLTVEAGEFVAIVGPSGSGKSSVMRLILGFENPWSGVVAYDGKDLAELDVTAVRRQMGTVLQASVPFGSTYRECICGPLQLDDDSLWKVIAESGLEREVQDRGLDEPLGKRGGAISGGPRQRLMIARALAGDPRVILLDEATSALDNVTQDIVMRSILGRPVTRIAIAHRLTTVERADRILVVSGGRIEEEGTPAELRASGGHFARLAARQEY